MAFENYELWESIIRAFDRLGAESGWVSKLELVQELLGEIDKPELSVLIHRLINSGVIVDDGGIGDERYFMLTSKAWEYVDRENVL